MEKFKLQRGEAIIKKGGITYWPPETKDMGVLKAAFKIKQCIAILTTTRFAGCTKVASFPFGPLIWLIMWLVGRKIIFQIALDKITRFEKSEKNQQFTINTDDNSEYIMAFDSFFDSREQWMQVLGETITKADPKAQIHESGSLFEVSRSG
jgi:hypothetical protein